LFASGLIWINPDWKIADPICTYLFSIIVAITTFRVTKDCILVLMESTPQNFNLEDFEDDIKNIPGIVGIHDVHVWSLTQGKHAMSAHLTVESDPQDILVMVTKICREYGITHSTNQIEVIGGQNQGYIISCEQDLH